MKFRDNYIVPPRPNVSTFYGVVHHDAQEVDSSWKNLYTSHSMEAIYGTLKKKNNEKQQFKKEYASLAQLVSST